MTIALAALAAGGCAGSGGSHSGFVPSAMSRTVPGRSGFVHKATRAVIGSSGFSGTLVGFEHSLVCDNGFLIANYAGTYGIGTIFVPVSGDDIVSLLAGNPTTVANLNAMTAVANVYMVTGDVSWLSNPTTVPPDVASLGQIESMYPQISGVFYDVDPEQSTLWNSQRQTVMQQYFTLVQSLLSAPAATSFAQTFFLSHSDFGSQHETGNPSSMLQQLQAFTGVTGTDVIVPGNSASKQIANVTPDLTQLTKPFWIGASTSPYGGQTYHGVTPSYLQSNLQQVQQTVSAQNAALLGIEVDGWDDLYDSLQSVLPQPPVYNGTLPSGPLVPASGTTYLGAYVNPSGTGATPAQTLAFEGQIGRTLAYNMHFYGWKQRFPGANEADDIAHGRIPLIAWNCGDTDARVASGADDAIISARARALKAFGSPVFVRWFWEMNLDDTNNAPRTQCYDPNTDLPGGYFSPTEYIAAWKHIRYIFAKQGVTNVVWLWCVAAAHGGPSQYYPGDSAVDWVGMDDYDNYDKSMPSTFYILANELSQFQEKPFMITETGAHAQTQVSYLTGAASVLETQFPWVRAIGYLDSVGSYQNWVLTPDGLSAFTTFAQDPYMSAMAPGGARIAR